MQALHFGAGNIGRGFIGKLLVDSQFDVTFVDVNQPLLEAMNRQGGYPVQIVGETTHTEQVAPVKAIHSASTELPQLISQVDLITTAVGPQILPQITTMLVNGLLARYTANPHTPLNIIACENMLQGSTQLKAATLALLPKQYHAWLQQQIGFVDATVDRIVPPTQDQHDPLAVTVESFCEWIVDQQQFVGPPPAITGMQLTDNLSAFVERKLFTLNTGHAISAYLGHYFGFNTIRNAILDPKIRAIVQGAMQESGQVLIRRYQFEPAQHQAYIEKILQRFANPYLQDETARVARQPIRKLSPNERLIKPLLGALAYDLPYDNLLIGIAAALSYRQANDEQSQQLTAQIAKDGVVVTLSTLSGIVVNDPLIKRVAEIYSCMQNKEF